MRVVLAIPPYSFEETYPSFMFKSKRLGKGYGAVPGATAPLGILYVAAVLRESGHDVTFVDGIFHREDEWIEKIKEINPDFIGVNAVSVFWEKTKGLAKKLKEEIPGAKIGIGGTHVTGIGPSALIEKGSESIDFLFLGESEYTARDFLKSLESDKIDKLRTVKPIWRPFDVWRQSTICWRDNGKIKMLKKQKPPQNLDELPFPARDLSPMANYCPSIGFYKRKPHATIWASRGCMFNCSFCTSKRIYRERSIELVMEEVKRLVEGYNIKDIFFYDNNIAYNKSRLEKFCEMLIEEKLDLVWSAQTRVTDVDEDILKLMKSAGCWRLCYGIETPSPNYLKNIRKGIDASSTLKAVNMTKKAGIEIFGAFIIGMPGETISDIRRTIDFACKLPLDYAKFNIFTPFPDSRDFTSLKKKGKKVSEKFTQHHVTFEFDKLTKEEVEKVFRDAYLKFYSRPRYLLKRLLTIRSVSDLERNFRGGIAFLRGKEEKIQFIP